jgi:tetratricopeptide (TPR) repeat protein
MNLRYASGEVLTWLGRPDESLSEYRQILLMDPRAVDAYNEFGRVLLDLGHRQAALEAFDAALGFHRDNAIVNHHRALALSRSGRYDEAVAGYRRALQQMPFLTEARIKLALLLVREGRLDDGLVELERVVELQPDNVAGHVELAVTLSRADRIAEAVPHYQQALRLNDRSLTALNNLAWIRATHANDALRDGRQAVLLAEAACEQTRYADPFYLTTLGVAYAEAGQFDDALRTSRRALELGADQPQLVDRVRQLMRFFESGKPYHEPPVG